MDYLVFATEALASAAAAQIAANMACPIVGVIASTGLPDPSAQQTTAWAVPIQRLDGSWAFPAPDSSFMAGVSGSTVATYDPSWFPAPTFP